ncbi:MAG: type II CAAX endopeptidase family protein [Bryobacteraceae bacterium]|nr:type II CAAX endopeptidase family protein [Bryobacteraceae bacterium]
MGADQPLASLPDQPPPADPPEVFWGYQDLFFFMALAVPSLLIAMLVTYGIFGALGVAPQAKAVRTLVPQFLGYGLWFISLYLLLKLKYGRPFWASLAWRKPDRGILFNLLAGPAVAFAVGLLGALLRTPQIDMPIREFLSDPLSIALMGIFATTLGPLCEELAFRGFLQPLVQKTLGAGVGIVVAALPFALLHGPQYGWSWRHILLLVFAAVAFGWTRHVTHSTAASTVMHAAYNLTFFVAFLFQRGPVG